MTNAGTYAIRKKEMLKGSHATNGLNVEVGHVNYKGDTTIGTMPRYWLESQCAMQLSAGSYKNQSTAMDAGKFLTYMHTIKTMQNGLRSNGYV